MREKRNDRRERDRAGFTLVEVLLVVAILGILAGVVVSRFGGIRQKAMVDAARASISIISAAVDRYEVDTGRYPPALNSLISNDGAPNWTGPYVRNAEGKMPADPWGREFQYSSDDDGYKVWSLGDPKDSKPIETFSTGAGSSGN